MKLLIVSGQYREAVLLAQELGMPKTLWKWISRPADLLGVTNIIVFRLDTVKEHPQFQDIQSALNQMTKLGRAQVCNVSLNLLLGIQRH